MAKDSVEIEIAATPDAVWATVGDFGSLDDWFPGIESFRLEGDDRVIGMLGLEVRERLLERDEQRRVITYSVVAGVPLESHRATIAVVPAAEASRVSWSFEIEPDEMAPVFADIYQKALEALSAHWS